MTRKTIILEMIFNRRWNSRTRSLANEIVTTAEVLEAIRRFNRKPPKGFRPLGEKNVYNFFKDIVRSKSANQTWPDSVLRRGYTAQQETGGGNSFRFIRLPAGQVTAFGETDVYPRLSGKECRFKIQSLSLDIKSRLLGRSDETWLMQVAVQLKLVQSHLALCSKHKLVEVSILQQNVKYGSHSEIDGLFLGKITPEQAMLITLEAKVRDVILESQVAKQVNAIMKMKSIKNNLSAIAGRPDDFYVLPMAMKVIDQSVVYIAEYEPVKYESNRLVDGVSLARESICEIVPPVEGILI